MSTGVIRISAALFALALLVGVFGLNTQPTQAQSLSRVDIGSVDASVPQARTGLGAGVIGTRVDNGKIIQELSADAAPDDGLQEQVVPGDDGDVTITLKTLYNENYTGNWVRITGPAMVVVADIAEGAVGGDADNAPERIANPALYKMGLITAHTSTDAEADSRSAADILANTGEDTSVPEYGTITVSTLLTEPTINVRVGMAFELLDFYREAITPQDGTGDPGDVALTPVPNVPVTFDIVSGTAVVTNAPAGASTGIARSYVAENEGEGTNSLTLLKLYGNGAQGQYEDDWLEILTGPGAGTAALIIKDVKKPAVRVDPTDLTSKVTAHAYGTITFDTASGLNVGNVGGPHLGEGTVFRIVEQNPTRTVELTVSDNGVTHVGEDCDPLAANAGPDLKFFCVTVDSDGVDGSLEFPYKWADSMIPDDTVLKFDLVAHSGAGARLVYGDGDFAARTEPPLHWVGRTITYLTGGADSTSLITLVPPGQGETAGSYGLMPDIADGDRTGVYTINVEEVPAFEDQDVTFRYGLNRRTVTTDKIGPIISNVTPAKGAVVQEGKITFQADVIDVSSGYTGDDGKIDDVTQVANGRIALEIRRGVVNGDDPGMTWTKITDGWRMTYENDLGIPNSTDEIKWRIIARDRAGAQTIRDHTSGSNLLTIDGEDPELVSNRQKDDKDIRTRSGDNWKASDAPGKRWRTGGGDGTTIFSIDVDGDGDAALVPMPKLNSENRKGILVVFDEEGGLDVSSVDASDFSVDGNTPVSVTVVDVFEDSTGNPSAKNRKAQEVFLLMGYNLASDGKSSDGDRLEVVLTGTVRDIAGNAANSSDPAVIADGIPPAVTVVVDDADGFDEDSVKVKVTVDETLNGAPTLFVQESTGSTKVTPIDDAATPTMTNTASQAYEATIEVGEGASVPRPNEAALINIVVQATDVADNLEEVGKKSDWTDSKAITFELDPELNNSMDPAFTVAGNKIFNGEMLNAKGEQSGESAEIEAVDPLLLTIDFSRECADGLLPGSVDGCMDGGEAGEYKGDTHKTVELSDVEVAVVLDDGTTAKPEFSQSSSDNIKFTISVSNPPVGEYTVSLKATDEAGNVSKSAGTAIADSIESDFTVKAAVPTELSLSPGWNLISLPFQPSNPGINSVLPTTHPASLVMSFQNDTGLWVVSRRDAETGMFAGDVRQMVATTAYFVFTDGLDPIKLIRPGLATAAAAPAVPSAIAVKAGWNLIPVLTYQSPLPGDPPGTGGVSADDYLGALRNSQGDAAWLRALLWDTTSQTWISVAPGETVTLSVDATNPCTGEQLDPDAVANGEEPCQAEDQANQGTNFKGTVSQDTPDNTFDGDDTVVMERHLPLGSGLWLWSTIDSVIFPTS